MASAQDANLSYKLQQHANVVKNFVSKHRELCKNEEQTKISLINPYLRVLGIDVNDPDQVNVEANASFKGESKRADYVVKENGQEVLLIEAKPAVNENLEKEFGQLQRYAVTLKGVKIASLTNGVKWYWYLKPSGEAYLDEFPFLVNDTSDPKDSELPWLSAMSKKADQWFQIANEQSTDRKIKDWISKQMSNPDDDIVKYVAGKLLGTAHKKNLELIAGKWEKATNEYLNEKFERIIETGLASGSLEYKSQNESSPEADSNSSSQDSETTKLMTKDGEVEVGIGYKRAWRLKEDDLWVVESNMTDVCKTILLKMGCLHDSGLNEFLQTIGETDLKIVKKKSEVAEDPNGEKYYTDLQGDWCYFKNEDNPSKIRRLRESAAYCIVSKKSIDFDSHFEIWDRS